MRAAVQVEAQALELQALELQGLEHDHGQPWARAARVQVEGRALRLG